MRYASFLKPLLFSMAIAGLIQLALLPVSATKNIDRQTTAGINALPSRNGHITGTVTAGANPLPNVSVTAYRYNDGLGWHPTSEVKTNASGYYDIGGLPPDIYRVGFNHWDYYPEYYDNELDVEHATDIEVKAKTTTPNINAALLKLNQITSIRQPRFIRPGETIVVTVDVNISDAGSNIRPWFGIQLPPNWSVIGEPTYSGDNSGKLSYNSALAADLNAAYGGNWWAGDGSLTAWSGAKTTIVLTLQSMSATGDEWLAYALGTSLGWQDKEEAPINITTQQPMRGVGVASVRDHAGPSGPGTSTSLQKAQDMKMQVIHHYLGWDSIEGVAGVYNWAILDDILSQARVYNQKVVLRIYNPPSHFIADGILVNALNNLNSDLSSQARAKIANFMAALTQHVKVKGYRDVVAGYVIGNEPNIQEQWFPGVTPNPAVYMMMLQSAYEGAKAGDPGVVIISAPLAPTADIPGKAISDLSYLAQLYDLGLAEYIDYVGMNGLGFQHDPDHDTGAADYNFMRLKYLHDVMVAKGDTARKVWALEVGWLRDSSYNMGAFESFKVSEEQQAHYLLRAFEKAKTDWADWLDLMVIWNLDFNQYYPPTSNFHWYAIAGTQAEWYLINSCMPTIQSANSGHWENPATWDLNRVPTQSDIVLVQHGHTVTGPKSSVHIRAFCNQGVLKSKEGKSLYIIADDIIANTGKILGRNGASSSNSACARPGSNVRLKGKPIHNSGTIRAGNGGDGKRCGGDGGDALILGQDTINEGTICAGRGGNVTGTARGQGGHGGAAHIWGRYYQYGGYLINSGLVCGGDGGDGNLAAIDPQRGGNGGNLKLISWPYVFLNGGKHYAGRPGQSTGGGKDGQGGRVIIEPGIISLAGSGTEVKGEDIIIFGGNDFTLDLSHMDGAAIVATNNITLAVGSGYIDLRGNTVPVLQAGNHVFIAANTVLSDTGLSAVVNASSLTTTGDQILFDVSLVAPTMVTVKAGTTLPLTLTVLNNGPAQDSYTLTGQSGQPGWSIEGLSPNVTLDGFEFSDLSFNITISEAVTTSNVITITATAQNGQVAVSEIEVYISSGDDVYLPIILRQH